MKNLDVNSIEYIKKTNIDDYGIVFSWENRLFRAIFKGKEEIVNQILHDGFLDELISKEYFPNTWMSSYSLEDTALVLEHEKIWPVVYPHEWTFLMLKDAATMVCEVAILAKKYGFNMKDSHGYNVLFDGKKPKYIDLGSFIIDECLGWKDYHNFLKCYLYPLKMWQEDNYFGKLSIFPNQWVPHESYLLYKYPLLRILGKEFLSKLIKLELVWQKIATEKNRAGTLEQHRFRLLFDLLHALSNKGIIPVKGGNMRNIINKLHAMEGNTGYKEIELCRNNDIADNSVQFDIIIEVLKQYKLELNTATEIEGSYGKFSNLLLQNDLVEKAAIIGDDEKLIDYAYKNGKKNNSEKVTYANFSYINPIVSQVNPLPNERFNADIVIALAINHQPAFKRYDIDYILQVINSYAKKYVVIEYIAKNQLFYQAGIGKLNNYKLLKIAFSKNFGLLDEKRLTESSFLLVGEKVRN